MDLLLARTFLEIIASGSFVNASRRLFVTQSAITLRVRKMEQELGRQLFTRSKSGISLTPAGEQFERYARSLVKVWDDALYQVAVPDGYEDNLIIGSQDSLWPRLGFPWLRILESIVPNVALRAELGMPDHLMRLMHDGILDIAILYTPQLRPGLAVESLLDDHLIMVSADADFGPELDSRYVYVDWGPEFRSAHKLHYPDFRIAHTTLSLGALSVRYIVNGARAGYLPARLVSEQITSGELHLVDAAPPIPFPAYVIWDTEKHHALIETAIAALKEAARSADEAQLQALPDT